MRRTTPRPGPAKALVTLAGALVGIVGLWSSAAGASKPATSSAARSASAGANAGVPTRWLVTRTAIDLINQYIGNDALTTSVFDGPSTAVAGGAPSQWTTRTTATFAAYGPATSRGSFLYALAHHTIPAGTSDVMYDDEDWAMTPAAELAAPGESMAQFVATAHANGYKAILAPALSLTSAMSCHVANRPSWWNYLNGCGVPSLVARARPDIYEIQAQSFENDTTFGTRCSCYQWFVTQAAAAVKGDLGTEVLAGLSTNPAGAHTTALNLYVDTLHTEGLVSGYWLNVPQQGQHCPTCMVGGDPEVAAQYLLLRRSGYGADGSARPTGYWLAASNGQVFAAGTTPALGGFATSGGDPVVGLAATGDGFGYWVVTADGSVKAFGDAVYAGDLPAAGAHVSDIAALAPTGDGRGYWLIGRDGGEFAFGDAAYHGSLPGRHVHVSDVVGMVATPDGGGYWLVGTDGGVFAFGDARFRGSLPAVGVRTSDVRAMIAAPSRNGYILVGADGGTFVFGSGVSYLGSLPSRGVKVDDITGLALTSGGYWVAGSNGAVYAFGAAPALPPPSGARANLPIASIAGA